LDTHAPQLGHPRAATDELARISELPPFYGQAPQQSDPFIAAAIDVAPANDDLQAARAALAKRVSLAAPEEFDLE
jgi:hypothetical protein